MTNSTNLLFLPSTHKANKIQEDLLKKIIRAQTNSIENQFKSAAELWKKVADDLKQNIPPPDGLDSIDVRRFADRPLSSIVEFLYKPLTEAGIPLSSIDLQAYILANRFHLLLAFDDPDSTIERVTTKVKEISSTFPKTIKDIERGKNPGDVLDPYILAATEILLFKGNFTKAISATVAHKSLMIIEGLMGHLHEDVLGEMRGNVRVPEPRGKNQEELDPIQNPFPGADLIQPPTESGKSIRFHQIKSKTGSAKGGDGKRLGEQLNRLAKEYEAEIFYDSLIGTTLRGHRSKAGVEKAAPNVVVLVGDAAFKELTGSKVGPELLLRVYQNSFQTAAKATGYNVEEMAANIVKSFQTIAKRHGSKFLEIVLKDSISGDLPEQDSRIFNEDKKKRKH